MHFLPRGFRFPDALANALARRFWRTENPSPTELAGLGSALAELWPRLARGRGQESDRHYSFDSRQAEAYAAYYLPANLMKVPLVLAEAETLGLDILQGSDAIWVDVGCGPGTALAGLAWWSQHRAGPARVVGVDQSPHFLKSASELQGVLAGELTRAIPSFVGRKVGRKPGAALETILEENPTVVSFVNSIAEIFPETETRADAIRDLIEELAKRAAKDGRTRWLVAIEPGAKDASRELLQLREILREEKRAQILLPCLDARPCGALESPKDWCHEEIACDFPEWLNRLGANAGIRKESLLFSYIVVAIGPFELPADWPKAGVRMVSQRLEHKGLTECWFCTDAGKQRRRFSHAVQKKREIPLDLPSRGDIFSGIQASERGEVESFSPASFHPKNFSELFPQ